MATLERQPQARQHHFSHDYLKGRAEHTPGTAPTLPWTRLMGFLLVVASGLRGQQAAQALPWW